MLSATAIMLVIAADMRVLQPVHPLAQIPVLLRAHDQVEAKHHLKDKKVKRGFVTSEGDFVGRKKAAKIAEDAGEIKDKSIKKLHSSDLRKGMGIKKNGKPAPVFLKAGDTMSLGIEGLGEQHQRVVAYKKH